MKKIILFYILLLQSLLYSQGEKTYVVIVPQDWRPYYYIQDNKPKGFSIELFEAIAKEQNISYTYKIVNKTKELYPPLKSGEAHVLTNLGISEHRKSFISYTNTTDTSKLFFYKRFNSEHIQEIRDIKDVGTVQYNIANRILKKKYPNLEMKVYPDHFSAIRALLSGELDVFAYPQPIMQYTLKTLHIEDKIIAFGKSLSETKRAIAVSKNATELIEKINKGLKKVIESGEYEKIYIKWFGQEQDKLLNKEELIIFGIFIVFVTTIVGLLIFYYFMRNKLLFTNKQLKEEIELQHREIHKQNKMILSQSKVVAIGEMLGNIAHQWRQPLSVITANASGLKLTLDVKGTVSNGDIVKTCDNMLQQANYLSQTIDDFRTFFMSNDESSQEYKLKEILNKTKELTKDSFNNSFIKVQWHLNDDVSLTINENLLIQTLINIFNNAKDALTFQKRDERLLFVSLVHENEKVMIKIKDSAGGIKENIIDRIFEPYFTTKHSSVGTGLGLFMSNQIVTKHLKGHIFVQNVEYEYGDMKLKGAEFIIEIPMK